MDYSYRAGGLATDEILAAIAGAVRISSSPRDAKRQLAQARAAVDERLAEVAMEHVLKRLEREPRDREALITLVLLGVEHPEAAASLRISPRAEALRLAELLRGEGSLKWAAELEAIGSENSPKQSPAELLRPRVGASSRRDRTRVLKVAVGAGLVLLLLLTGLRRELELRTEWAALPAAEAGDLSSVRERVSKLASLLDGRGLWLGMPAVAAERLRLEGEMRRLARVESQREEDSRLAAISRSVDAEEAREKALLALEAGSVREARHWLAYALERGGSEWAGAGGVSRDLVLLGGELSSGGSHAAGGAGVTR
ncbi:MAG: hypothetical protein OSB14_05565 [Planctomycetota bacterium]|nr:hypothetical protein [Planctomycetota bacterium]